jgi:hypothetical protein
VEPWTNFGEADEVSEDGEFGDTFSWSLSDDGVLILSGQGAVTSTPWCEESDIPVRQLVVNEGITALPAYCFYNDSNLVSVSLPSTFEGVRYADFYQCPSLERVSIAGGTVIYMLLVQQIF